MIPRMADAPSRPSGFPRVSGDDPGASLIDWVGAVFSPRERG